MLEEGIREEWKWLDFCSGGLPDFPDETDREHGDRQLATVVLSEFVPAKGWYVLLHNQTAWLIKAASLYRRRQLGYQRTVIDVPYYLGCWPAVRVRRASRSLPQYQAKERSSALP